MDITEINSIRDINLELVKQYLRIDHDLDDLELSLYIKSVVTYIEKYANYDCLEDADLIIPALLMIADCYENKSLPNASNTKLNEIFSRFLWMNRGLEL